MDKVHFCNLGLLIKNVNYIAPYSIFNKKLIQQ
jgi:hypothetical protein